MLDAEAVPKRILDIMNVDKLTRENVANHLQASLKNLSCFSVLKFMIFLSVANSPTVSLEHQYPSDVRFSILL